MHAEHLHHVWWRARSPRRVYYEMSMAHDVDRNKSLDMGTYLLTFIRMGASVLLFSLLILCYRADGEKMTSPPLQNVKSRYLFCGDTKISKRVSWVHISVSTKLLRCDTHYRLRVSYTPFFYYAVIERGIRE